MTAMKVIAATAALTTVLALSPAPARATLPGPAVVASAAAVPHMPCTARVLAQGDDRQGSASAPKSVVTRAAGAETAPAPPDDKKDDEKAAPVRSGASPGPTMAAPPDLAKLRADYDSLREHLFEARVRSQKAADLVYNTRLDVRLRWKGGPDFVIRKARFLLDGAELWDSGDRPQTDDLIEVASRAVKPGPHALTVALEIRPRSETKGGTKTGADKLGYTSEHVFAIVVAGEGQTHVLLTGDEDGDPPEYEPGLELEVKTEK